MRHFRSKHVFCDSLIKCVLGTKRNSGHKFSNTFTLAMAHKWLSYAHLNYHCHAQYSTITLLDSVLYEFTQFFLFGAERI